MDDRENPLNVLDVYIHVSTSFQSFSKEKIDFFLEKMEFSLKKSGVSTSRYSLVDLSIRANLLNVLIDSTVAFFATVQKEGDRQVERNITYYNLDMIISVGYRVNLLRGVQFRMWATSVLREYLVKGFVMNDDVYERLDREIG